MNWIWGLFIVWAIAVILITLFCIGATSKSTPRQEDKDEDGFSTK